MSARGLAFALVGASIAFAPTCAFAAPESPIERVSFARALELARARNPNAIVAAADIARAEALVLQARATSLPLVTGNASYTRLDGDRIVATRVAQAADSVNANVNITVPIIAPQRWSTWRRAEDSTRVSKANAAASVRDVLLAAGRAYLAVLLQKKVLRAAAEASTTARAHAEFAQTRFKGGVGTRTDVVRSEQEFAVTESQKSIAQGSLARAQEALGVILGGEYAVDVEDDVPLQERAHAALAKAPPDANSAGPGSNRSDVAASRQQMLAAERAYKDCWREYAPLLSATFQPFYQNPPTLTLPTTGWQAQLLLSVPFYDGGMRYGVSDERAAVMSQARARSDGLVRQAKADVRVAETLLRQADVSLAESKRSAELAHEAARLVRIAYEAGSSTNLELVDADRRARDADTQTAVAEDALHQASLELLAALGLFP